LGKQGKKGKSVHPGNGVVSSGGACDDLLKHLRLLRRRDWVSTQIKKQKVSGDEQGGKGDRLGKREARDQCAGSGNSAKGQAGKRKWKLEESVWGRGRGWDLFWSNSVTLWVRAGETNFKLTQHTTKKPNG